MNMAPLVWLLMILSCSAALVVSSQSQSPAQAKNIFILGGQSNMAGRAGVNSTGWDKQVPPECMPNPNILRLNSSFLWQPAYEPLHFDIDVLKFNGIGPGMPFANRILQKNPNFGMIGLVPCAVGGTSIDLWKKGTELHEMLVTRARASLDEGGEIRAMLWYQGEADIGNGATYNARFEQFVTDVRAALRLPNLPVIQVALDVAPGKNDSDVRQAQLSLNFPNVKTIDAKGQPLMWDNVHLNTDGAIHVGQMFADAYLQYFAAAQPTN